MNVTRYLWLDTDNALRVRGLADQVSGAYINDALITATLYDADGAAVPGAADLDLAYVTASDGDYVGVIPYTVTLTEGAVYYAVITVTGNGYRTTYKLRREAAYKDGPP